MTHFISTMLSVVLVLFTKGGCLYIFIVKNINHNNTIKRPRTAATWNWFFPIKEVK